MIATINAIVVFIFDKITYLEAQHTQNEDTYSKFIKITLMQYVNISVIILLLNFNLRGVDSISALYSDKNFAYQILPILAGSYSDFSVQWYFNVGASICLTLSLNIVTPHVSYFLQPFLSCLSRCCDRGCSSNIKLKPMELQDDGVNTKL